MFKDVQGPIFGGVIVLSHQASQLGMKLVMAQARPSNQRLSPGGEVLHSRRRFGRQHFEVIVSHHRKGSLRRYHHRQSGSRACFNDPPTGTL